MSCAIESRNGAAEDKGALVNNYMTVRQLGQVLGDADHTLAIVPALIREVIEDGCYTAWLNPHTGERGGFPPKRFREFIVDWLETPLSVVRRFLGDDTPERLLFEKAIRGEAGDAAKAQPRSIAGTFESPKDDHVTLRTDVLATLSLSQGIPRARQRDEDLRHPTGNSTSYAIRQLERGRKIGGEKLPPRPDLIEKVKAGELSIHRAMLEAGFRKPTIQLPVEPAAATRLIVKHFRGDDLEELIRGLANWAGIDLAGPPDPDS